MREAEVAQAYPTAGNVVVVVQVELEAGNEEPRGGLDLFCPRVDALGRMLQDWLCLVGR